MKNLTMLQYDLIHNIQELGELNHALTKWLMGKADWDNINEEIEHAEFAINNVKQYLKRGKLNK